MVEILYGIQQKNRLEKMEFDMFSPLENHAFHWETNLYIVSKKKSAEIEIEQNDEEK